MEYVKKTEALLKEVKAMITDIIYCDNFDKLANAEISALRAVQQLQVNAMNIQRDLKANVRLAHDYIQSGNVPVKATPKARKGKKVGSRNSRSKKD